MKETFKPGHNHFIANANALETSKNNTSKSQSQSPYQMMADQSPQVAYGMEIQQMANQGHQKVLSSPTQLKRSSDQSQKNGLPNNVQAQMENTFQTSFAQVQFKKDSSKATELGAHAFTKGNEVHFAPGQFQPETKKGQQLIGHELAHVVQQKQGRVKPTTQLKGVSVNDDNALEREADIMGAKAANQERVTSNQKVDTVQQKSNGSPVQMSIKSKKNKAMLGMLGGVAKVGYQAFKIRFVMTSTEKLEEIAMEKGRGTGDEIQESISDYQSGEISRDKHRDNLARIIYKAYLIDSHTGLASSLGKYGEKVKYRKEKKKRERGENQYVKPPEEDIDWNRAN